MSIHERNAREEKRRIIDAYIKNKGGQRFNVLTTNSKIKQKEKGVIYYEDRYYHEP